MIYDVINCNLNIALIPSFFRGKSTLNTDSIESIHSAAIFADSGRNSENCFNAMVLILTPDLLSDDAVSKSPTATKTNGIKRKGRSEQV